MNKNVEVVELINVLWINFLPQNNNKKKNLIELVAGIMLLRFSGN